MGDGTGISWTDATWNPVRGCSRVSEGCRNCYAERVAARFSGPGQPYEGLARRTLLTVNGDNVTRGRWTGEVRLIPEHLTDPLRWKKPRLIFVNSMSDLFHEKLTDVEIDQVLAVMLLAPRHTFQILTKRAGRMQRYFEAPDLYDRVLRAAGVFRAADPQLNQIAIDNPATCPKPWIWLGVSVENQEAADERIPELLGTPAAVRFLSCEPLLGPVDISEYFDPCSVPCGDEPWPELHWVIAGCESGPGARPCSVEWLRSLRDQCAAAGVPYFLKQARPASGSLAAGEPHPRPIDTGVGARWKQSAVIELPYLDGVQHAEFPTG